MIAVPLVRIPVPTWMYEFDAAILFYIHDFEVQQEKRGGTRQRYKETKEIWK